MAKTVAVEKNGKKKLLLRYQIDSFRGLLTVEDEKFTSSVLFLADVIFLLGYPLRKYKKYKRKEQLSSFWILLKIKGK